MQELKLELLFENPSAIFLERFQEAFKRASCGLTPAFLSKEFVRTAAGKAGLEEADLAETLSFVARLRSDPIFKNLVWTLQLLLASPSPVPAAAWPKFTETLGRQEEIINLLLALSLIPAMEEIHEARRIPDEIRKATVADIPLWLKKLHGESGRRGLSRRILCWLDGHLSGRLYRVGRLQFIPAAFSYPCAVCRSKTTGSTAALALDGLPVDSEGFIAEDPAKAAWTSSLSRTEREIKGFLIDPCGKVSKRQVSLDADDWSEALVQGSAVIDTHIPEDGPLDAAACRDSFAKGLAFFKTHFPEIQSGGFICTTWLFDPCLLEILKPSSNILAFYKEFLCVPLKSHSVCTDETLWRVFGKGKGRLDEAPKDSSLKQAVYQHFKKGGIFRESGGFILNEDLHAYGSQRYWRSV